MTKDQLKLADFKTLNGLNVYMSDKPQVYYVFKSDGIPDLGTIPGHWKLI